MQNLPDFQWKYKTKKSMFPWGLHLSWIRFSLMFLHHITNGFREVKQQFSFLRTKACRVKKNVNIFKALSPTVLFISRRIQGEKKVSYCIILSSLLMKFAFKATAWKFCKGKWFLNEQFWFPMNNVLTTSSASIIKSWLYNPLESL